MDIRNWFKKNVAAPVEEFAPVASDPGALPDPRTPEEKAKDYQSREVFSASPVTWREKDEKEWRKFPIRDQDGSSSCVGHAVAKALGIENLREEGEFVELSPRFVYVRRVNKGGEGMFLPDAMQIGTDFGATLEVLMPSNKKSEVKMNDRSDERISSQQIAQVFKAKGYVTFPSMDIDEIASVIDKTGKGVVVCFRFDYAEWTNQPFLKSNSGLSLGHCVTAVDYTLDALGRKCLIIDDSWGSGTAIDGQRLITEEFLEARCFYAGYFVDLSNNWREGIVPPSVPKFNFAEDMKLEDQSAEVSKLQDMLKFDGYFPVSVDSTGYYGNITAKAVLAWQLANNVNNRMGTAEELKALEGKFFGPRSRATANTKFA